MKKKDNRKKIKKIIIMKSNKVKCFNSSLKYFDSINNSLFPKIKKDILKRNDNSKNNIFNKKSFIIFIIYNYY